MYSKELEELIEAALADGVLTDKEKQILFKKAKSQGIDLDEFEMILEARLLKAQQLQNEKIASISTTVPKSNKYKYGDIRTCPQCGAVVPAISGVCPECGYEVVGVNANHSSQKLAEILNNISNSRKNENAKWAAMAAAVSSFPIPNTKEDLFEFAIVMQSKMMDKVGPSEDATLMVAYFNKYKECITKIKALYSSDIVFKDLLMTYSANVRKTKKAIWWKEHGGLVLGFSLLLSPFILGALFLPFGIASDEKDTAKIDAQYESLLEQINELPVPTKKNCAECAYEIQKIDWQVLFSSGWQADDEMKKRKAFYERKNAYIDLLQKQGAKIEKVEIPKEPEPSLLDKLF